MDLLSVIEKLHDIGVKAEINLFDIKLYKHHYQAGLHITDKVATITTEKIHYHPIAKYSIGNDDWGEFHGLCGELLLKM